MLKVLGAGGAGNIELIGFGKSYWSDLQVASFAFSRHYTKQLTFVKLNFPRSSLLTKR